MIPDSVVGQLSPPVLERFAGNDRYHTAVLVAERVSESLENPRGVYIATGKNFPDALAGSLGAVNQKSVLLTVDPVRPVSSHVRDWMTTHPEFRSLTVLGGTQAISDQVMDELNGILP